MSKTLIFGTVYLYDQEMTDIVNLWIDRAVSLGKDFLLVDSNSPEHYRNQLKHQDSIHSFDDNIGHLSKNGRDGWGRAFCYALQYAIDNDYDNVIHIESDMLVATKEFKQEMEKFELGYVYMVSSPFCYSIHTCPIETGLMMFKTKWVQDFNFIKKYDWETTTRLPRPEERIDKICEDFHCSFFDKKGKRLNGSGDIEGLLYVTHTGYTTMKRFYEKTK